MSITTARRWIGIGVGPLPDAPPAWAVKFARATLNAKFRASFYRKLAALLRNSVRIKEAVGEMKERANKRNQTDARRIFYAHIYQRLSMGQPLSASLKGYVPSIEQLVIEAGERSHDFPAALEEAAESIKMQGQIKSMVIGGSIEPLIMFGVIFAALKVISQKMIPALANTLPPEQWEGTPATMYAVTSFVDSGWFTASLILFVIGLVTAFVTLPSWTGRVRALFDAAPPWSVYKLVQGGVWMQSLAMMIGNDVQIKDALRQMQHVASPWLRERITSTLGEISKGSNFGKALDATGYKFPDRELIDDLIVYSRYPNFGKTLAVVGKEWSKENIKRIELTIEVVKWILRISTVLVVLWLVLGILGLNEQIVGKFQGGM